MYPHAAQCPLYIFLWIALDLEELAEMLTYVKKECGVLSLLKRLIKPAAVVLKVVLSPIWGWFYHHDYEPHVCSWNLHDLDLIPDFLLNTDLKLTPNYMTRILCLSTACD